MPVDFEKLLEQEQPQIENRLWIGTARISRRIPGKFELDEYGQLQVHDIVTNAWFIDVTTRGRHPLWAPGWDIVMGHKRWVNLGRPNVQVDPFSGQHLYSDEGYTEVYMARLRESYRSKKELWERILRYAYDSNRPLILCCYCSGDSFCHRRILAEVLVKVAKSIGFRGWYGGEWFHA